MSPKTSRRSPLRLPTVATLFLRRCLPWQRDMVRLFHRWMNSHQLTLSHLTVADVQRFLDQPTVANNTRRSYRSRLLPYLHWLHARQSIDFLPDQLRLCHPVRLPKLASDFLSALENTLRPNTCSGYRSSLANFHRWLVEEGLALHTLTRPAMSRWCHRLLEDGLHPASRTERLSDVRVYLRWLAEQGVVCADPDDLVRRSDFPKLPSYLPRPLPPDVDRELQRRLAASEDLYHRGLLLMRNTGMRISELISLEHDCLRIDPNRRPFLKVPLGKLHNERLVPLDDATHALVLFLQRHGHSARHWLLEDPPGHRTRYQLYRRALEHAGEGLQLSERLTTHRLRHSYATGLLAGGMSLVGVMRLLGHRDFRMTLRYTAITDETIGREYDAALQQIEKRYRLPVTNSSAGADPARLLDDVVRSLRRHVDGANLQPLLKRVQRLKAVVQRLLTSPSSPTP
jgi:integrase/recombinase XerC